MKTSGSDPDESAPGLRPDGAASRDPKDDVRVARLLRWYPTNWRERYGDEFADVLASSISDGRGGFRLSLNVAREGAMASLEEAGFVGRSASHLQRARASVVAALLGAFAFLASAAVLIRYAKGWQRTPVLESLNRAGDALVRSHAHHVYLRTVSSLAFQRLEQATNSSSNPNSQVWKTYDRAFAQANNTLAQSEAGRAYQQAAQHFHPAFGAPVVFNQLAQIALFAAFAFVGVALLLVFLAGARTIRAGHTKRLRVPMMLLLGSAALFVLGATAYEADHKIPPGQPGSEWTVVKWMVLDGQFRFWPVVVLPLCAIGSILLATVGSVLLLRRVDMGRRLLRLQGCVALAIAGGLGIFLVSTLCWAATLSVQAPDFLTATDQGIFGTPLLPIFIVTAVVMAGAVWMVIAESGRCLRNVRSL